MRNVAVVLLLAFSLAWPALAAPSDSAAGVNELRQQMEALLKQVAAQNERIRALETRLGAPAVASSTESTAAPGAPPPVAAGQPAAEQTPATGNLAPRAADNALERHRGLMLGDRVKLGGYGSMRLETAKGGLPTSMTFRRFVLTTDAQITDRLRVHSETEFERLWGIEVEKRAARNAGGLTFQQEVEGNAGGEISIEQIWGQYNFHPDHGLRFGVVLPPLGRFNILHDDDYWDIPRRTLVDRDAPVIPVKSAWREMGIGLVGGTPAGATGRLNYEFYVLNGSRLDFNLEHTLQTRTPRRNKLELESELGMFSGAFNGTDGMAAVAYRLAYSPTLAGEIAVSGYHGRYAPGYFTFKPWLNSAALDGKWKHRNFEAEGEFVYSSFGRLQGVLNNFANLAFVSSAETTSSEAANLETEIEMDLGGLARTRYGFWTDLKYHWRPAWMKRTFLGRPFEDAQLIPIVRYERVWLNGQVNEIAFSGGQLTSVDRENLQQDRVIAGISYRPVPQFSIQAAFERNRRVNGSRLVFPAVDRNSTNGFLLGMAFAF